VIEDSVSEPAGGRIAATRTEEALGLLSRRVPVVSDKRVSLSERISELLRASEPVRDEWVARLFRLTGKKRVRDYSDDELVAAVGILESGCAPDSDVTDSESLVDVPDVSVSIHGRPAVSDDSDDPADE
jgi:hypothetical protein